MLEFGKKPNLLLRLLGSSRIMSEPGTLTSRMESLLTHCVDGDFCYSLGSALPAGLV